MNALKLLISMGLVLALFVLALPAADAPLERATQLYNRTEYEAALRTLQAMPAKTGPVYELMGKSAYMKGDFKRASEAFEKAVAADASNSNYFNWLGRAYGRRAETASFITAPGLASRAREAFERAVELDGKNIEAADDLFEYYLEAPGIMGGGLDKAAALAERIKGLSPAEYHCMRAKVAERRKEYKTAEEQLRLAISFAPRQVGRFVDLAKFLAKRGRYQESDEAFARAEKVAPGAAKVLYERAATYVSAGRNLDVARDLLQRYLEAPLTPDDPPRGEAERLLKRLPAS